MTVHAWIAAADKARKEAPYISPAAKVIKGTPLEWRTVRGALERAEDDDIAVQVSPDSRVIIRKSRSDFDAETLGYRVKSVMLDENSGNAGRRQDVICSPYIAQIGIGRWAEEFLRRTQEQKEDA